ncbi:hypothetical protein N7488_004052 [Penicillium malachiteum]|nr:hypothetical protein N7488_004052 [Penicillium malachiteum]
MGTSKVVEEPREHFVISTPRLIIIPTPQAISSSSYRKLYASLHADKDFCNMAFGVHFPPRQWSDDETRDVIQTRDIGRCWNVRGMGDFAVGLRPADIPMGPSNNIKILKGDDFGASCVSIDNLDDITWVGYAGVRDGTTTSIPPREAGDLPLPPWNKMVEVRYGMSPLHWGNGFAKEAAEAVMHWAVKERGVARFIAETEKPNKRSARALEKLGFTLSVHMLKWVKGEINSFGGDSERITVEGQSSGSACALDMIYSPLAGGPISGVIAESGVRAPHDPLTRILATSYREKDAAEANGAKVMSELNATTTLAEMRNLTVSQVLEYITPGGTIYDDTPYEDVPILTVNNVDKSGASTAPGLTVSTVYSNFTAMLSNLSSEFFPLYPLLNKTADEAKNASNAAFDDISRVSSWIWAKDWYSGGAKSDLYTYFWTRSPPGQDQGAFHGSEMYYVFNNLPYTDGSLLWAKEDSFIESYMTRYWANFIRSGNPNGADLPEWPVSGYSKNTMWLGNPFQVEAIADDARIDNIEK